MTLVGQGPATTRDRTHRDGTFMSMADGVRTGTFAARRGFAREPPGQRPWTTERLGVAAGWSAIGSV